MNRINEKTFAPEYMEIGTIEGHECFEGLTMIPLKGECEYIEIYNPSTQYEPEGYEIDISCDDVEVDYMLLLETILEWCGTGDIAKKMQISHDQHHRFVKDLEPYIRDFVKQEIERS